MALAPARVIGAAIDRADGPAKVTGAALYAYEHQVQRITYLFPVLSAIARGRVTKIDAAAATALPGVLAVLTHENALKLAVDDDPDLLVLQNDEVAYHGQIVAAVVAESLETARHAAGLVRVEYAQEPHDVILTADHPNLYKPETVNAGFPTDTDAGDIDAAIAQAPFAIDCTYTTPCEHNQPLEPHATLAVWEGSGVTLYDANQGPHGTRNDVAKAFGIEPDRVRVISPYVGGGFGSKLFTHPHVILTVMAARIVNRPVKIALTRQAMFSLVGYRTPTIQRMRLAAERDGRMTAIAHDVIEQTSKLDEFAEQTAVATRMMYAAPNRRTSHRLARLDVPTPTIMRAPGECPGMFALESAMDELAIACGIDPIELRIRNEPADDPSDHRPFSSRGLVACLREGAERFGWSPKRASGERDGAGRLVGHGVAASTYPTRRRGSSARITLNPDETYDVDLDAVDIGTGTWTSLAQIAADALDVPYERIRLHIGDSALPTAPTAGGSMGLTSWGTAIVEAAQALRRRLEEERPAVIPAEGVVATAETGANPEAKRFSMHAYGAQFAEVHVDADTGEVRVPRMVGVFAIGRVINAKTARSQLLGGMTMGLSMALFEESVIDPAFGDFANHDFASYHIAANADVGEFDIAWIDEDDKLINPMGAKGIGEIGITGTAAAIANAVHDATGIRIRDLPIRPNKLLEAERTGRGD